MHTKQYMPHKDTQIAQHGVTWLQTVSEEWEKGMRIKDRKKIKKQERSLQRLENASNCRRV